MGYELDSRQGAGGVDSVAATGLAIIVPLDAQQ